jgi:hypothetical protein
MAGGFELAKLRCAQCASFVVPESHGQQEMQLDTFPTPLQIGNILLVGRAVFTLIESCCIVHVPDLAEVARS